MARSCQRRTGRRVAATRAAGSLHAPHRSHRRPPRSSHTTNSPGVGSSTLTTWWAFNRNAFLINVSMRIGPRPPCLELGGPSRIAEVPDACASTGPYRPDTIGIGTDFDRHSDVDFIVAIEDELSDAQVHALQAMHERIYNLDCAWAQHLEGSYFPK